MNMTQTITWGSMEETAPEGFGYYLTASWTGEVQILWRIGNGVARGWYAQDGRELTNLICYWAELPKHPKKEAEND
jgi:hypothetical protein